jgi:hypothetical protein
VPQCPLRAARLVVQEVIRAALMVVIPARSGFFNLADAINRRQEAAGNMQGKARRGQRGTGSGFLANTAADRSSGTGDTTVDDLAVIATG